MTIEATTDNSLLRQETRSGIACLTLNRPTRFNALSSELIHALQTALDSIADDASIRVVIIAAAGRGFCAGHDLKEIRGQSSRNQHRQLFDQCSRLMISITELRQPVIASVNGIATAAGCQLVATCDLAISAASARFAVNGIDQGLFCSTPAVALSRNLSRKQALKMLLTGEFVSAEAARDQGLVNDVVDDDQLTTATWGLAEAIAAKSPTALSVGKSLFYRQLALPLADAYKLASGTMAGNMDSADAREGVDAFFAKRQPVWKS